MDRELDGTEIDADIADGMLRWTPGTLPTRVIERIIQDAAADLWQDCFRRDNPSARERLFAEKLADALYCATDRTWNVERG